MTWDCYAGLETSATDASGATTSVTFTDPFSRPTSITDPTGGTTTITYGAARVESSLTFNNGNSTQNLLSCINGLGRPYITQRKNGPGSGTYDSVEIVYDAIGHASKVSPPYSAAACSTYGSSTWNTTTYDALGRMSTFTDAGGGTRTYVYTKNDVLVKTGPAPSGETLKQRQLEYDALGRLTSVCEVSTSLSGYGTCNQSTAQQGYWTTYTYDVLGDLTGITQNSQSTHVQSRTYVYDGKGRPTSETNPESGTTAYIYDTNSTCGTYNGDLVKRIDAVGDVTCFQHDALHRLTIVAYPSGSYAPVTAAKTFVYDAATVNNVSMANAGGRLAEAYTGSSSSKTTDLGFSYSARGELTDIYESTPHSSGYYHVSGTFWENGLLKTLGGVGLPTLTYTPDGEGRVNTVSRSSGQNPVTGTAYNLFSNPPNVTVTLGSTDSDSFNYDPNTGRMTAYNFNVNSKTVSGALTWNANGTLNKLVITDPYNSSNAQTCNYGYDDLARLASANCGSVWSQTFTSDAFGNLKKSGTISFQPAYTDASGNTNNRVYSLPGDPNPPPNRYDANGNLTSDGVHNYAWDADGKMRSVDSITLTFDALDRPVEKGVGTTYTELVFDVFGRKLALMNGQTLSKAFLPLPGGGSAVYTNGLTLSYYRHPDWLGSSRFASLPTGTSRMYYDGAYAPYGENYAEAGTTDRNLTGQNQDIVSSGAYPLYDFLAREHHPVWGRWLSPDPAGLAAANPRDPQTWNRYAYVRNSPLNLVDPLGLESSGGDPCTIVTVNGVTIVDCSNTGSSGGNPGGPCKLLKVGFGGGLQPDEHPCPPPIGGGGGASGKAPLSPKDQARYEKLKDEAIDQILNNPDCIAFLCSHGIDPIELAFTIRSQYAFNGGKSTITMGDAGLVSPSSNPAVQDVINRMMDMTVQQFFKNSPTVMGISQLGDIDTYYRPGKAGITEGNIIHEGLHNSGFSDDDLKTAFGKPADAPTSVINDALKEGGCIN